MENKRIFTGPLWIQRLKVAFVLFLCCALGLPATSHADVKELPFITVYAASSLTLPLTEAIRLYTKTHPITITALYESSSELEKRIEDTNDADLFISAAPEWIDRLKQLKMIDNGSITTLYRNRLALVTASEIMSAKSAANDKSLRDILLYLVSRTILVLGDPEVTPLGVYTREALQSLGLWKRIEPMIIRAANARMALYLIAKGKTTGIVYHSDAFQNPEVRIIARIPENLHSPILYQGAVIKGDNMAYARQFLMFLQSKEAAPIFTKHGLVTID